ncbi:MAG: YggS family pyridoxal phosphate enzyme [Elusimicrobia bacterium RIFCSPLOWO2_01_FULL_60_11]|nr:MAG: YggS family pyridoxal phosphate enzyme [Elusimicrobia bacterium RIFCSPLOWO2_01_FULL_60_11]
MIRANLEAVRERIQRACRRSGRDEKEITLIGVTKKVPRESILEALSCGLDCFGESYVQEARDKITGLKGRVSAWHMIGRLQSNKANRAVELFDVVQSVDSLKLLGAIDRKAAELRKIQDCFIEIKVSEEHSKGGLAETGIESFLKKTGEFKNIRLAGMMTMAPFFDSPEGARPYFKRARKIFEKSGLSELSMGMSGDFEAAIEEGSTMVRVGRAIFGARA